MNIEDSPRYTTRVVAEQVAADLANAGFTCKVNDETHFGDDGDVQGKGPRATVVMLDDDGRHIGFPNEAIHEADLVAILGRYVSPPFRVSIALPLPTDDDAEVELTDWAVVEMPDGTRFFFGYDAVLDGSRISSPIVDIDEATASGRTRSGRRYSLVGESKLDGLDDALLLDRLRRLGLTIDDVKVIDPRPRPSAPSFGRTSS